MAKGKGLSESTELRQRAEKLLGDNNSDLKHLHSEEDSQRLVHELEVHQIELEMQNAALSQSRDEVESALERYTDHVEAFCRALHLRPRLDPTNRDPRYLRNALRSRALPALERATGRDVVAALARTADLLREHARRALLGLVATLAGQSLAGVNVGERAHRLHGKPALVQGLKIHGLAHGRLEVDAPIRLNGHSAQHGPGVGLLGHADPRLVRRVGCLGQDLNHAKRRDVRAGRPAEIAVIDVRDRDRGRRHTALGGVGAVGFVVDQTLKKVRLEDGSDAVIAPYVEGLAGATWREDDTILLSTLPKGALFEVSAKGGTPQPLVIDRDTIASGFYFPHFLPGGRAVVFNTESTGGLVGVLDLTTGKRKTFGRGLRPSYIESGYLVFANAEGRLVMQAFDLDRLDVIGTPITLSEDFRVGQGRAFYSVSRGGTLAIIRADGTVLDLSLFDRTGHQQTLFRNGGFWAPRFSPDGNRIAFGDRNPDDLWLYDLRTRTRRRFTLDGAGNNDPAWSPDGKQIAFATNRPSTKDIVIRATDGTGAERQLVVREGLQWPSDWTRSAPSPSGPGPRTPGPRRTG